MKKREDFNDDGRTIADMSAVERPSLWSVRRTSDRKQEVEGEKAPLPEMPKEDRRAYILISVLTALGVAAIFLAAIGLAIWLMLLAWK